MFPALLLCEQHTDRKENNEKRRKSKFILLCIRNSDHLLNQSIDLQCCRSIDNRKRFCKIMDTPAFFYWDLVFHDPDRKQDQKRNAKEEYS